LNHFLNTGETVSGEMDIGDAYRLLQIPDRTADEEAVMAAYTICIDDSPDQAELYNRALSVIAKEMDSQLLKGMAGISSDVNQNLAEWPVGLQNIGNTCYLNSLLQFYFSVRPFRDMVLDIEKHQMDLNDIPGLANKKVGSRKVTGKEVQRSLTCRFIMAIARSLEMKLIKVIVLGELRTLFQNMITSSQSCVAPTRELARLTLISPGNEEAIRRRSTISKPQALGEIGGAPILGPLGPPQPIVEMKSEHLVSSGADQQMPTKGGSDADSEATLVSESNNPAPPAHSAVEENEQTNSEKALSEAEGYVKIEAGDPASSTPEHPSRPPPVPPRPVVEVDRQKQLLEEVEIGAQQDVTEVINNVLFQSQCAIKPLSVASDGEQVDQIKE
jgi:ubiquitin carboxyl-terminal hydrolase 25/28